MAARGPRGLGSLPQRRHGPRDLLDFELATGGRHADVHGRAPRPLERGAHRVGYVRADPAGALDQGGRGRSHPGSRRPRAPAPLRSVRDRSSASSAGGDDPPRGGTRGGPRRGPSCRVRDGVGEGRRGVATRLLGGARARGPRAPRAAADVRPTGGRVHVHPAALPGAQVTYVWHYVTARLIYDGLVGTGVPVIALLAAVVVLLLWRRRR